MKYLIANWKASINRSQLISWMGIFFKEYDSQKLDATLKEKNVQIVLCPPFPLLDLVNQQCKPYASIVTGAQHVSSVDHGPYTGEVTADVLTDYVNYSIVGHSERRTHFHLSESDIQSIIDECQRNSIQPILCIRNQQDQRYSAKILAYEPVEAIGSGHNASIQEVLEMKKTLNLSNESFLYGGSVDADNMKDYLDSNEIDGFLVGTASLDPVEFLIMTKNIL